jgi:hypothetical protein
MDAADFRWPVRSGSNSLSTGSTRRRQDRHFRSASEAPPSDPVPRPPSPQRPRPSATVRNGSYSRVRRSACPSSSPMALATT